MGDLYVPNRELVAALHKGADLRGSDRDEALRAHGYLACWDRQDTFHVGIEEGVKYNANLPHPDPDEWHVAECVRRGYNTSPPQGWTPTHA